MTQTEHYRPECEVKVYLQIISALDKYINIKLKDLANLKELSKDITIHKSKTINKITHLQKQCNKLIEEHTKLKREIANIFKQMDKNEAMVLELIYLKGLSLAQVSKLTDYSQSQLFKLHDKALINFQKIELETFRQEYNNLTGFWS